MFFRYVPIYKACTRMTKKIVQVEKLCPTRHHNAQRISNDLSVYTHPPHLAATATGRRSPGDEVEAKSKTLPNLQSFLTADLNATSIINNTLTKSLSTSHEQLLILLVTKAISRFCLAKARALIAAIRPHRTRQNFQHVITITTLLI